MNYTKANSCNDRGTFHIRHYGTVRSPSRYRSLDHHSRFNRGRGFIKAGHPHSRRVLLAKQMGAAVASCRCLHSAAILKLTALRKR
jgi:hypothetical protein